jgi:putative transposase
MFLWEYYCYLVSGFVVIMKYNPDLHHRRSLRIKGFDYSSSGAYFITICTHNRECILGDIVDGEMQLNQLGNIVRLPQGGSAKRSHWQQLSQRYQNLEIDESIVMPNHLHGIIILLESSSDRRISISESSSSRYSRA